MKGFNKLILYIGYVVLITLLVFFFYIKISDIKVFTIVSGSMEPSIVSGSMLFHQKTPFDEIQVGDVITYKLDNATIYITHRVIKVDSENQTLLCKGDSNANVDSKAITNQQYQGTVLFHIPYLGYVMLFLGSDIGKSVLSVCMVVAIISIVLDSIKKIPFKNLYRKL